MSITRSESAVASTWIFPSALAATTAVLPTMPPSTSLSSTVPGHAAPSCQAASQPTGRPSGVMEKKFIEYASAAGTPQLDKGTGITRA
jgi:hypothetical protein